MYLDEEDAIKVRYSKDRVKTSWIMACSKGTLIWVATLTLLFQHLSGEIGNINFHNVLSLLLMLTTFFLLLLYCFKSLFLMDEHI